jgi:hypothetical protein
LKKNCYHKHAKLQKDQKRKRKCIVVVESIKLQKLLKKKVEEMLQRHTPKHQKLQTRRLVQEHLLSHNIENNKMKNMKKGEEGQELCVSCCQFANVRHMMMTS